MLLLLRLGPLGHCRLSGPGDLAALVLGEFGVSRVEEVLVIVLNKANKPLKLMRLTSGSQDACLMPVRDVLAAVLRHDGAGFAVAHNHPSGDAAPSVEDVSVTKELLAGAQAVGLNFVDHLIVGSGCWVSLDETGCISASDSGPPMSQVAQVQEPDPIPLLVITDHCRLRMLERGVAEGR